MGTDQSTATAMKFATWNPIYEAILKDMGYDRREDERVRDVLASLSTPFDQSRLDVSGQTVAIAGAGPSLEAEADEAAAADAVIAASTAAERLGERDVDVDLVVTDLDKTPKYARKLAATGTPIAVHAHGDNGPAIRRHVPKFAPEHVLPTTQARPVGPVQNFGGFTDGDRAAFLADHFDAGALTFPGWDFDDPSVSDEKRQKLRWAARLLGVLERRRDEQFAVLDSCRADLEAEP
jgi:hypothetical protein